MLPKITFGLIVLNGEPFTRYNLRALYPYAHEIIVVEGASPKAAHVATADGHSIDGTVDIVRRFMADEDPEHKIILVTAEDDGHPNGFWPGEKDQQSQAYARRATGDWLWQIDIDEFYLPEDMQNVCGFLASHPQTTCLTFNAYHFWGGFDYLVEGGLFINHNFQGEPWGAYRRLFRWAPGLQYLTHRPPTLGDATGNDITARQKRNLTRHPYGMPVRMYHYTNLFPKQVIPKGAYYAGLGQKDVRQKFERFDTQLDEQSGLRIYSHYGTYNWLQRFDGQHPPVIEHLRADLKTGQIAIPMRQTNDIEQLLASQTYRRTTAFLQQIELLREHYRTIQRIVRRFATRQVARFLPRAIMRRLPVHMQTKLAHIRGTLQ
ncbi:MAG: glycosyltransferase family A protein [Roseiflexaceae bacterium]|nr:glycosyltransferase family A protein [Roseiflexaceae bacterium]